ncbi:MAG TPA: zf-HC2 domain-containing protein [Gemmatimonadales bacterium]|nr:zf-HC2 domain-containing protein [Gemmatimonadales bacterium]
MTHPSTDILSAYLDGELDPEAERETAAHLAGCPECATLLAELRRVLVRAQALEDRPPRDDLWPGVAAAIGAAPSRRWRVNVPVPLLLAAGIALMLLSGSTVALLLRHPARPGPVAAGDTTVAPVPVMSAVRDEARGYDLAVRALTQELEENSANLDSNTVRIVQQKLAIIDRAIAEAERAVAADPANTYLNGHLNQTRLRKLDLLRRAAAIGRAVS